MRRASRERLAATGLAALLVLAAPDGCATAGAKTMAALRAEWRRASATTTEDACRDRERVWLALRRTFGGHGAWLPPLQEVGDCWISLEREAAAREFYRTVKREAATFVCSREGESCTGLATRELRRLDCGFGWVAASPEQAWRDVLQAIGTASPRDPAVTHLEPAVVDRPGPDAEAESCPPDAFALPPSFTRTPDALRKRVLDDTRPWGDRALLVEAGPADKPWKNFSDDFRFLHLRACPTRRPVPGKKKPGYFMQLTLLQEPAEVIPCDSTTPRG